MITSRPDPAVDRSTTTVVVCCCLITLICPLFRVPGTHSLRQSVQVASAVVSTPELPISIAVAIGRDKCFIMPLISSFNAVECGDLLVYILYERF